MHRIRPGAAFLTACLCSFAALAQPATPAPPTDVSGPELSILIRTTLIALHDANVTGNYSVLRDLGAVELQTTNTAADLAAQFAEFRQKRIGMAPVVLYDAVLDEKPQLSTNGHLHLVGHIPSPPQEVVFDLWYFYEAGAWRVAQIGVATRPAKDAGSANKPGATAEPPKLDGAADIVPPTADLVPPTTPVPPSAGSIPAMTIPP